MPSLATVARKLLAARDKGKAAYAAADEHLDFLIAKMKPGQSIDLGQGQTATLTDQFADRNVVWKPAGVRRLDLTVSRA